MKFISELKKILFDPQPVVRHLSIRPVFFVTDASL